MIQIEFQNGNDEIRLLSRNIIMWYLNKVMPRIQNLYITVVFSNCFQNDGAYGYCSIEENNRNFEIEIDENLNNRDFIFTLCHELTHLKQYARNEMKVLSNGNVAWKNKTYYRPFDYDNLPWEKEAFLYEKEIGLDFIQNFCVS